MAVNQKQLQKCGLQEPRSAGEAEIGGTRRTHDLWRDTSGRRPRFLGGGRDRFRWATLLGVKPCRIV